MFLWVGMAGKTFKKKKTNKNVNQELLNALTESYFRNFILEI